jgi:hypothetical protein
MWSHTNIVLLIISRPQLGLEILGMSGGEWLSRKMFAFFPDGMDRACSDCPLAGVTLHCKWQGHFVLASAHKERWILESTAAADIDLEFFGPEWTGCTATLMRMQD